MPDEVLLQSYPDESLARFWQEVLLDNNIRSMVKPLGAGYGAWGGGGIIFHGLYVLAGDEEAARTLLGDDASS